MLSNFEAFIPESAMSHRLQPSILNDTIQFFDLESVPTCKISILAKRKLAGTNLYRRTFCNLPNLFNSPPNPEIGLLQAAARRNLIY